MLNEDNNGEADIKRKTLYSILSDYQVFDNLESITTTIIEGVEEVESDEEGD